MGRGLRFESWRDTDGLHVYRHVGDLRPLVERWTPTERQDLSRDWLIYDEDSAILLALAWRLAKPRMVYVVPRYWRESGFQAVGDPYALVHWEYEVENENSAELGSLRGFVPARSSVRMHPPPGPWQVENAGRAGLFEAPVFSSLQRVFKGLTGDATAELNLFALPNQTAVDVFVSVIEEPSVPPRLAEVLGTEGLFVDISFGIDLDYSEVVVIHSPRDIAEELSKLVDEYNGAIASYEDELASVQTFADWERRVDRLMNLGDEATGSRWAGWT